MNLRKYPDVLRQKSLKMNIFDAGNLKKVLKKLFKEVVNAANKLKFLAEMAE